MGTLLLPCINIKNIIIGNLEDGDEFLGNFLETRSRSSVKWVLRMFTVTRKDGTKYKMTP